MNIGVQRLCVWSGFGGILFSFSFILWSQFIPPPGPTLSIEAVTSMYQSNATGIRIGMVCLMIGTMFMLPYFGVISGLLHRIESPAAPVLAYTQLAAGTLSMVFFIVPALLFIVTSFRPDRMPEITYALNDLSWIFLMMPWPPFDMVFIAVAVAVFMDKSPNPVFPRWVGFYNIWTAILFTPGTLVPFLKTGPFAWNGLLTFWLAGGIYFLWYMVMTPVLFRTIRQQAAQGAT